MPSNVLSMKQTIFFSILQKHLWKRDVLFSDLHFMEEYKDLKAELIKSSFNFLSGRTWI